MISVNRSSARRSSTSSTCCVSGSAPRAARSIAASRTRLTDLSASLSVPRGRAAARSVGQEGERHKIDARRALSLAVDVGHLLESGLVGAECIKAICLHQRRRLDFGGRVRRLE
eukprot:5544273-Prymnesium_polylepis.1